jgi:hypothetical protein
VARSSLRSHVLRGKCGADDASIWALRLSRRARALVYTTIDFVHYAEVLEKKPEDTAAGKPRNRPMHPSFKAHEVAYQCHGVIDLHAVASVINYDAISAGVCDTRRHGPVARCSARSIANSPDQSGASVHGTTADAGCYLRPREPGAIVRPALRNCGTPDVGHRSRKRYTTGAGPEASTGYFDCRTGARRVSFRLPPGPEIRNVS